MASQQEKAFCVLRFEVSRSVITVQREFRAWFRKDAPGQCSMNFVHGLEKTHLAGASFLNRATRNSCWWHMSVVSLPVVCYVPSTVMTA